MTRKKLPELRARVTVEEKIYLMAAILRDPTIFSAAYSLLDPALFDPVVDSMFLCVWRAAKNVADKNDHCLPADPVQAKPLLQVEVCKVAQFDPGTISSEDLDYLVRDGGFLDYAYGLQANAIEPTYARGFLTAFLEERTVFAEVTATAESMGGALVPANLQPFLDKIDQQRTVIQGLNTPEVSAPFYQPLAIKPLTIRSTGCLFLDRFMNGGDAPGEMYTLMAPTGCGKTLLAVQIFMLGAHNEQKEHHNNQQIPLGHWYYFNYEDTVGLRNRLWANAAEIDHTSLDSGEPLSTTGGFKPYEEKRFAARIARGAKIGGEKERLADAERLYTAYPNFYVHDFSGTNPGVGSGGVAEIQRVLDLDVRKGRRIAGVIIDYAGLVVERQIESGLIRQEDRYSSLNNFGQQVVNKICARFGARAWVLHQLHGDVSKKSPTAKFHHSDAQGARNFANAAWFPFQIGIQDDNHLASISCYKSRRAAGQISPSIVRVDGAVCRMYDENDRYMLTAHSGFVRKVDAQQVVNVPTSPGRPQRHSLDADPDEMQYGS